MTVEEKQGLCQQSPVFRNALAAVAAELVDWSRGEDEFVSLFRDWCCDQMQETGLV